LRDVITARIEATRGEWQHTSEENLNAAKWESLWETYRNFKDTVDKGK
jgi:hypothetical protein